MNAIIDLSPAQVELNRRSGELEYLVTQACDQSRRASYLLGLARLTPGDLVSDVWSRLFISLRDCQCLPAKLSQMVGRATLSALLDHCRNADVRSRLQSVDPKVVCINRDSVEELVPTLDLRWVLSESDLTHREYQVVLDRMVYGKTWPAIGSEHEITARQAWNVFVSAARKIKTRFPESNLLTGVLA